MKPVGMLWVLGHRVRPLETDPAYAMVEVTSPPRVPGPPPHHHHDQKEFFFVVRGTLDVMINGDWRKCPAGTFVELAPNTSHTFINNSDEDAVWVTGWRPKGFEKFFLEFGVPVEEADAAQKSVSPELIQRVVAGVERYGMILSNKSP
jgi:quercetin dioxygenase-like cupin family protein